MQKNLSYVLKQYGIDISTVIIEKDITGHINESFRIFTNPEKNEGYFLQWINHHIFKDVDGLMNNITIVSKHLKSKLQQAHELDFKPLEIVPTTSAKQYATDQNNEYWRMYHLISNAGSYNKVDNIALAYEGGKAFGKFIRFLCDLPAHQLKITIPDFHNLQSRLQAFYAVLQKDPKKRVGIVAPEIELINSLKDEMLKFWQLIESGQIPSRITHNDTKFNNILFNSNDIAVCVVDWDTIMPGSLLFDVGDAIRTTANTATEDEKNMSLVGLDLSIFENYTSGYIKLTNHLLTPEEKQYFAFSAQYMTFIIGLRFLTDYIDGDNYYRILYPEHNLVRSRVQFTLLRSMKSLAEDMEQIVQQHFNAYS